MPSVSRKQRKFMAAAAHDAKFADRAGIDQEVAKEFNRADARRARIKAALRAVAERARKRD